MLSNIENTTTTSFTFRPRRGDIQRTGRLVILQMRLEKFIAKGSKSRHVNIIKDIILGVHSVAENWIDHLISRYYLAKTKGIKFRNFHELLLTKLTFFEKIFILNEMHLIDNKDFEMLRNLNTIRNAFVHGYNIRSSKFLYKRKKITAWGQIEILVKDFEVFLSKISGRKIKLLPTQ